MKNILRNAVRKVRDFMEWLQSPKATKYAPIIVACSICIAFLCVAGLINLTSVKADATGADINEVRMASVDYVFQYENITVAERDALRMYVYQLVDSVKLLHMVNMRQHVVFSSDYSVITLSEDGNTLYVPVNANPDEMWDAIDKME